MTPIKIAQYIAILLIILPIVYCLIKYANTPVSDLPAWVYFVIGR